jgi:DNA-binding NarL/FixJ family response regulator
MASPPNPIRVATVEDDPRYRASIETLLRHAEGFVLVGAFGSPAEALRAFEELDPSAGECPDLVLMDLELPGMSGIECTRRLKLLLPRTAVVVLTVFEDRARLVEAIAAGADGYLLKRTPAAPLLEQLRSVMAGGSPLSAGVARTVLDIIRQLGPVGDAPGEVELTPRERDVLACLVQGMSYKAVARDLTISIDTVRSHIRSVYRKLQVNNVAEAVGRALREGLV